MFSVYVNDGPRASKLAGRAIGSMLRFLLNVPCFMLGAFVMDLDWWLACMVAITIVGIPRARARFVIGNSSFWPFGCEAVNWRDLTGWMDFRTAALGLAAM